MNKDFKVIFAGTPEFGLPCLVALSQENIRLQAIYTQPDRPSGRGRNVQFSPIKSWGIEHDIPVYQPVNFKSKQEIETLQALQPDLMIVIAYGLILPKQVLTIPRLGCINVHASILPRWRGASPIQHAILHDDKFTGVTIMQMDVGMDTGDYYTIKTIAIDPQDTAKTLHDKLATLAVNPLIDTLKQLQNNPNLKPSKQDNESATYAAKINKEDAEINWQQAAKFIACKIRAFNPWPLAFTTYNSTRFQILDAQEIFIKSDAKPGEVIDLTKNGMLINTGNNALLITKIKFPGKNSITISDYVNANNKPIQVGTILP